MRLPTAFLPDEDQGILLVQVQLPSNASVQRTETVLAEVRHYLLPDEAEQVAAVMTVSGVHFPAGAHNSCSAFDECPPFHSPPGPAARVARQCGPQARLVSVG